MRIRADQLARELGTPLGPAWLVTGDEPLLVGEAADVIRARARDEGYLDRETFFVEPRFDWGPVLASSQSLSLFSSRRLLEIRMPAARPGVEGGRVLAELAAQPPPDTIVLVVTGRLERDASSSAWVKAFEHRQRAPRARVAHPKPRHPPCAGSSAGCPHRGRRSKNSPPNSAGRGSITGPSRTRSGASC